VSASILFDNCGEFEQTAWVPLSMARTREAARCIIDDIAEMLVEVPSDEYIRVDGTRVWMKPDLEFETASEEERAWKFCNAGDRGAEQFWACELTERRFSIRRGWNRAKRVRRTPELYRRLRGNGWTRRRALAWTYDAYISPRWVARLRIRGRRLFRRRFGGPA